MLNKRILQFCIGPAAILLTLATPRKIWDSLLLESLLSHAMMLELIASVALIVGVLRRKWQPLLIWMGTTAFVIYVLLYIGMDKIYGHSYSYYWILPTVAIYWGIAAVFGCMLYIIYKAYEQLRSVEPEHDAKQPEEPPQYQVVVA